MAAGDVNQCVGRARVQRQREKGSIAASLGPAVDDAFQERDAVPLRDVVDPVNRLAVRFHIAIRREESQPVDLFVAQAGKQEDVRGGRSQVIGVAAIDREAVVDPQPAATRDVQRLCGFDRIADPARPCQRHGLYQRCQALHGTIRNTRRGGDQRNSENRKRQHLQLHGRLD